VSNEIFKIGNILAKPGSISYGSLGEIYLPDSTEIKIPLIVIHGANKGPKLMISSTIHGTEITGADVIRKLVKILKPENMNGTVICLPVLNPLAFHMSVMNTPQDQYNMNRVFPGDPKGLTSFRIANIIYERAIKNSDYIIDFHANPFPAIPFSIVRLNGSETDEKVLNMAKAFGITTIRLKVSNESHRTGTIIDAAISLKKPALTIEALYWRRIDTASSNACLKGVLNVMKLLGMIEGKIERQEGIPIIEGELSRIEITANKGGFVDLKFEAGDEVKKGDIIAEIWNPYGEIIEKIESPLDGYILAYPLLGNQAVATGDILAFIAYRL
jgi:Predicted deacylase